MRNKHGDSPSRSRRSSLHLKKNVCNSERPQSSLGHRTSEGRSEKCYSQVNSLTKRSGLRYPKKTIQMSTLFKDVNSVRKMPYDAVASGDECREDAFVTDDNQKSEKEYIRKIEREIINFNAGDYRLSLNCIAGLDHIKDIIKETMILPARRPDLFKGLRTPVKGVLLFGPPGTGKTFIARCIASEMRSTFFNISPATIASKWTGESEKMVKTLFSVARYRQPSIIFIDEIDGILCQRGPQDTGAARRIKNEFLVHMDGTCTNPSDKILILGITSRPQELDDAARRRFVLRLYIPLPDRKGRKDLLRMLLEKEHHNLRDRDLSDLSKKTEGFSGADLKILSREAAMGPIRSLPREKVFSMNPSKVRPINKDDFKRALSYTKPTVTKNEIKVMVEWNKLFGRTSCLKKH